MNAQLRRHMRDNGRCAIPLRGKVAAGHESHAHFARKVRLRLGNLSGDEGIGASGNRRLEIALRAATAPRYFFNSCVRRSHLRNSPF